MDRYRPKGGRIFGGIFLLFLAGLVLWFIIEGFIIFTPFAKRFSFRSIGGDYVEGRITEIRTNHDGDPSMIEAEYWIGLQRVRSNLPAFLWYIDGMEVRDSIRVPYSQKDFEDMTKYDKLILSVSVFAFAIFLIWSISLFSKEIAASRYFQKLILNKSYVNAQFVKSEYSGNRVRAVCKYNEHRFESRWYPKEKYPFQKSGAIRVYVNLSKDSDRYLISEN